MKLQWPIIALWQCFLVVMVHSAALSTEETLIIAKDNGVATDVPHVEPDTTTDEPHVPIKLTDIQVHSEITLRYAHTAILARVRNPARRAQEASFRVLLPDTAFISGFVMTLHGKSYKAYVKGKEEAKQVYNEAVSQGLGAAHVAAKARDSNHFTVSVNVEPNTTALFNLTYEELLVRRNGVYNHAINLHPGAVVPNMQVTVHIKESQKITQLRVPEMRTGNEVDATELDAQNPLAVIQKDDNKNEATVTFKPDLEEQKRLVGIYSDKMRQSSSSRGRGRWYESEDNEDNQQDGILGQFVVQYDVDHSNTGEILVNDGYFVHFLAPTSIPPLNKHVVFVLDTSSSMIGRKIVQLREAMQVILGKLNRGDYFNIVEFNSYVQVHDLNGMNEPEEESPNYMHYSRHSRSRMVEPALASTENINKAKTIISQLDATSLTNIYEALEVAIELIHKGVNVAGPSTTDSENRELNSTKSEISTEGQGLEPIVIFLTDGEPTAGETDTDRIISRLTEMNKGEKKASIYTLALGDDADRTFLRKFSLRNNGFMRHIYEAADVALQLQDFYRQVASPLLANVKFTYPKEQIMEGSVTRNKYRTIYDGGEVIVAGKIADDITEITPQVSGICGVSNGVGRTRCEMSPRVPVTRNKTNFYPLERLWAYLTIKQLLDEKDAVDSDHKDEKSPENRALSLALKYEFVTPLTSLVVVKPNSTTAVGAEPVDAQKQDEGLSSYLMPIYGTPQSTISNTYARPNIMTLSADISDMSLSPRNSLSHHIMDSYPIVSPSQRWPNFHHHFSNSGRFRSQVGGNSHQYNDLSLTVGGDDYLDGNSGHFRALGGGTVSGDDYFDGYYPQSSAATTPAPSPLIAYKLEEYSWASPLLNTHTDSLVLLYVNGTEVILKLSKGEMVPQSDSGDVECAKATDGAVGACVYLTRCAAAKHISVDTYRDTQCSVNNEYAGVCCPRNEIITSLN